MRLAAAVWFAFATHAAAALASLLVLQHGSPVGPAPAARMDYVATHLVAWRFGWACWTLASISLVLLLFALDRRAAWIAVVALPVDLPSQWILAAPAWAYESLAYFGTGVLANAVYTLAFAWAALTKVPPWLRYAALPAIVGGMAVSAASLVMHPTGLWWSMALLSAGMIAWLGLAGVWASRGSSS